ncbi:hypothetical protein [Gimesia algae]|uniref:Uncharacterized protein n=1 Tax=Gimesia algae TaxID=2527971 RepID=A0A517VL82_9PLAN|nr:hypothetical protein [Gimesia algae]QDT93715.1 hypothetical protein Pan161_53980 [Gimesia algae]
MRNQNTLFLTILLLLTLLPLSGCGYPAVSPKTYEISKALYSVCNQKSTDRLKTVQTLIGSSLQEKEINEKEAGWLNAIVASANAGDWDTATQEARRLMEDQTGR